MNTLSDYTCFYISENITSHTLLVFKIVESLQCSLKCNNSTCCINRTIQMTSFQLINKKINLYITQQFCSCSSFNLISGVTVALHLMTVLCILRVHSCRFENLPICSCSDKNNTLKISHS